MDDDHLLPLSLDKIQISGPIFASLLHRFSSSPGSVHGLLFGHVSISTPSSLSDDHISASSADDTPLLTATVTSFLSFPSNSPLPLHPLPDSPPSSSLIGWFSGRRRTPLRPSLYESTTTHDLAFSPFFPFSPQPQHNSTSRNVSLRPSLFILFTTPFEDQLIHTNEYRAYMYSSSTHCFEPKSLDIINVGPSFRSHYGSFSPNSAFPLISYELSGSTAMVEDHEGTSLGNQKKDQKNQKELNFYANGFDIGKLGRLMGSGATRYTADLELLYAKMLAKLEALATSVESTSAKVVDQENHNMKMRLKVAGLE